MTDLQSREDYQAIADEMVFPSNAHINGKFTSAKSGETFETVNPATGQLLAKITSCGREDVDYAVKKAGQAFDSGVWSKRHPSERKEVLIKLVKLMKRHRYELAVMESLESGKPIRDCALIDIPETLHCLAWYAEAADKLYDRIRQVGEEVLQPIDVARTMQYAPDAHRG